jgi:hypothetical protein
MLDNEKQRACPSRTNHRSRRETESIEDSLHLGACFLVELDETSQVRRIADPLPELTTWLLVAALERE